ncbi:uncharacterized protein LOC123563268 [Mercenaria mercenaria]|uniref:uncharacterized protein LOC123563268 n=1 Tax=Mercenaria mercenaria TaxID=6596 RepID=UPI00234F9212|nr:uncharacterized protein LOC123563268 [Mercenaria mercenaria]
MSYVKERDIDAQENLNAWKDFEQKWKSYVKLREIETGEKDPKFPDQYGIKMREEFYESISESKQPGGNGCDATIIAYDVFLSFDGSWEDLCIRSICHGGLSNVTCSITACWYGAMFGYDGVKDCNYKRVEFWRHFKAVGHHLYNHSYHEIGEIPSLTIRQPEITESHVEKLSEDNTKCIYVREGFSINRLIESQVVEIRKEVTTDEAIRIGDAIYIHLRHFMDKLGNTYPNWSISELLKVGSFHEGTKIYFPDEFDFIAVLSALSEPDALTVDIDSQDEGKVELCFNETNLGFLYIEEDWDRTHRQENQAIQMMEKFCKKFYNTVMSDRKPLKLASVYDHFDYAEPMSLPPVNGIELLVRLSEARLPNMVLEFFYKDRRISVDITLAVRYRNIEECFSPENATVPEIGRAVVERGSLLLVAYMGGFRITLTETEVEYIRERLNSNHKILYLYLKYFNYKYGEHEFLKVSGYLPFSSYMLKTIVIHHDKNCKDSTPEHETCLRDVVEIMQKSIDEGYLYEAETLNGTVIGYLPSVFDKFKNLYKEPYKSVKCLKGLRNRMVNDLKAIHFSGRTWSCLDTMLQAIDDTVGASAEAVCQTDWWPNRKQGLMLKLK